MSRIMRFKLSSMSRNPLTSCPISSRDRCSFTSTARLPRDTLPAASDTLRSGAISHLADRKPSSTVQKMPPANVSSAKAVAENHSSKRGCSTKIKKALVPYVVIETARQPKAIFFAMLMAMLLLFRYFAAFSPNLLYLFPVSLSAMFLGPYGQIRTFYEKCHCKSGAHGVGHEAIKDRKRPKAPRLRRHLRQHASVGRNRPPKCAPVSGIRAGRAPFRARPSFFPGTERGEGE